MIEFQQVGKDYDGVPVIDDLSLTIPRGEFAVLIGASGSGKSTTLRMINRLVEHDRGRIVQAGSPAELLSRPADARVVDFIGRSELGIQLLGLRTVADVLRSNEIAEGEPIAATASLREALSVFVARGVDRLAVSDADRRALGAIHFADLLRPPP